MKYCGRCGQETDSEARFCQACGYEFAKLKNNTTVVQNPDELSASAHGTHPDQVKKENLHGSYVSPASQPEIAASYNTQLTIPSKAKKPRKKVKMLISVVLTLVLAAFGGFWGWRNYGTEARSQAKLDLGVKYLSENDYEKAILAFDEAIKIDPKEIKGYQGLAKTYTLQGKYDDAKATYERGTAVVKPEYQIVLRLSLAGMYIDKGDLQQAETFFREIVNSNNTCVDAYIGLSLVYQQQGNKQKVLATLEQCAREIPQDYRVYNALAKYYFESSDKEKALQNIVKSLDLEVNQQEAYSILSIQYYLNPNELANRSNSVEKTRTANMLKFYGYYTNQGYSEALSQYQSKLAQDKGNMKARVLGAICMLETGDKTAANQIVENLSKEKLNAVIMADLSWYYHIAWNNEKAQEWAEKAISQKEFNPDVLLLLADLNRKSDVERSYISRFIIFSWQPLLQTKQVLESNGFTVVLASKPMINSNTQNQVKTSTIEPRLYPVKIGELWGFIDRNGKMVIQPRYDWIPAQNGYIDEMIIVHEKNKGFGFVGSNANMVIQPQYGETGFFSEGLAYVERGYDRGYIDKTGSMILRPPYKNLYPFHEGLAAVEENDKRKYGFIDRNGKLVIDAIYDEVGLPLAGEIEKYDRGFSDGLAAVKVGDKWGFIDKNGKMVIEPQYKLAFSFSDGLALVVVEENVGGFIDKTGRIVIALRDGYGPRFDFSEGLAAMGLNGKYGFIDKTGTVVIQPQYDAVESFHEGLAPVRIGDKWGVINTSGQLIINAQYKMISEFRGGWAGVETQNSNVIYIDTTGQQVWPK